MKTYSPKKEWMAYCVGAFGQGMVYAMMSSYISDFYMNVMKLTPMFVLFSMVTFASRSRFSVFREMQSSVALMKQSRTISP